MKQEYILKATYEGQGEIGKLRGDLNALGKIESIRALGKDVRALTVRFNESKAKLEEQAKEMRSGVEVTQEMTRAYKASQKEVTGLAAALEKKQQAFRAAAESARASGVNTLALASEEKRLQVAVTETNKVLSARKSMSLLDVRPIAETRAEIARLTKAYVDLKNSGTASAADLGSALKNLRTKTKELYSTISTSSPLSNARSLLNVTAISDVKAKMAELTRAYVVLKNSGTASTDALSRSLQNLRLQNKALYSSVAQPSKLDSARSALGVQSSAQIKKEITQLNAAYEMIKKSGTSSAADILIAQQQLKAKTAELTNATNLWAASYAGARNGAVAMAGVGYGLLKSFKEFASFETGMAEVYTLVDVSTEKFKEFKAETKDIVGDLPQESKDLTKALYDIISAGVQLEDSNKVLELSAKAATAGVTDTKTAVNAGIGAMNAYGENVDALGGIYDVLFQTVKLGVTTFPELSQSMGDILPTARAADVGLTEVAATIATLTKAGIKTPQAATALRGAILAMAAPAPEAKKKFDELGITWEGLIPTLESIAQKGLSIDQMRLLIPDQEAAKGILSLTQNLDVLKITMAQMDNAGGSMDAAYQKMADTPEHEIKQLMKSLTDLVVEIGGFASKVIVPAAESLGWLVSGLNESSAVTKIFVHGVGMAATAGILWQLGLKDIYRALVVMKVGLQSSAAAMFVFEGAAGAARAGITALTAAAAANPVLAALSAGVLVAGAAWVVFGKDSLAASRSHAEAAKTIGKGRKAIDDEVASLEKLQQTLKDTEPGTEAHLQAERDLARLLPTANLALDEQGRLIAKVGGAAEENGNKLAAYIALLKDQSRSQLALQVEQQAKAYAAADQALQTYKNDLQNWYGIGQDGGDWASAIWRGVNKLTGTYDANIKKGEEVRTNLNSQKTAYNDLLAAMNKTGLSADDLSVALDKAHVSAELKESVLAEYRKLGGVIEGVASSADKSAEKQKEAFRSAAESIKKEYLDLAEKVKSTLNDIAQRNRSFASEVRAMNRDGLTDAAAWTDLKKEAGEYADAAKNALAAGNYDEAIKLADEAKSKYKELSGEVKDGERVVVSEAEARKKAIEGMTQANAIAVDALKARAEADQKSAKNLEEQIGDFKTGWSAAFETFLSDGKESIKALEAELDALTSKKRSIDISVSSSESHQSGGAIGLRMAAGGAVAFRNMLRGGFFPGFGGGDRRHVIGEDGEYMFDKYRVRDAGLDVVREFHRGNYGYVVAALRKRLNAEAWAMKAGGIIDSVSRHFSQPQMMAVGGPVVAGGGGSGYDATFTFTTTQGQVGRVYGQEIDIKRLESAVAKHNRYRSSNR